MQDAAAPMPRSSCYAYMPPVWPAHLLAVCLWCRRAVGAAKRELRGAGRLRSLLPKGEAALGLGRLAKGEAGQRRALCLLAEAKAVAGLDPCAKGRPDWGLRGPKSTRGGLRRWRLLRGSEA